MWIVSCCGTTHVHPIRLRLQQHHRRLRPEYRAACLVAWWWVAFGLVGVVMIGRVYVGAHNPLDVTAGLGTGLFLGGLVAALAR